MNRAVRTVVKQAAIGLDRVWPPRPGVVALIYHRVGGASGSEIDLPAGLFDEQMAWLAERDAAATLADALVALDSADGASDEGPDPIVVTFDDGTADFVDVALPIIVAHRVPVTYYVATDFIERARPFPNDGTPLSWAAVREAVSTGLVDIGSHTDTHLLLDRAPPAVAAAELDRSRRLIEDRVDVDAVDFAYPKAVPASAAVDALVRQRFRSAAIGGCRPNPYGATDPYRLARSAVQTSDGMRHFARKATGGMHFEESLRRLLNRRRYAGAAT